MSDLPNSPNEEGPKAAEKFKAAMKQILSVPKAEIDRRETEYLNQRRIERTKGKSQPPKNV